MKAVLFLCLLAFMACEKDIIDIGKCIYKAPKVQELISDVIVAIATKDYSKLLPKIKEALPELIKIVLGCITDTKAIEEESKLEVDPFQKCLGKCGRMSPKSSAMLQRCIKNCIQDIKNNKSLDNMSN